MVRLTSKDDGLLLRGYRLPQQEEQRSWLVLRPAGPSMAAQGSLS